MTKTFVAAQADPHKALREFNTNRGVGNERICLAEDWEAEDAQPVTNAADEDGSLATTDWE